MNPALTRIAFLVALGLAPLLASPTVHAQGMRIDVTGVGASQVPIVVSRFGGKAPLAVDDIIRADLERSGLFKLIADDTVRSESDTLDLSALRGRGADSTLVGSIRPDGENRFAIVYKLVDTVRQTVLIEEQVKAPTADLRLAGHRIADQLYEKLTGNPGIFSTRVAFVTQQGTRYQLNISDWDGNNVQTALNSAQPIISPAWSPDGRQLAYVSFETGKPVVWIHTLSTGRRRAVADFRGSNSSPAWSPDGTRLAVTLTRDGNSEIYTLGADGTDLRRITQSASIDTEPVFSPDGSSLYFTSDRGGSAQIYRMPMAGGQATRVTFSGDYNVSPRISPNGRHLAWLTRRSGRFLVALRELSGTSETLLTDEGREESPSFSPNSRWIMYSTRSRGGQVLMAVTVDGEIRQRLTSSGGDIREPAWGPYPKR